MNIVGDFQPWAPAFPHGLLPEVFSIVLEAWPHFTRPEGNPLENRITQRFVGYLIKTYRNRLPFSFNFRVKITDSESDSESGELDIAVKAGIDPNVYFAFECKRLRVPSSSGRTSSGASEYIGPGGMGCFISGQYNGGGNHGGMLGYVMDNNIQHARNVVNQAIIRDQRGLNLLLPNHLHQAGIMPCESRVLQTKHLVDENTFFIYHMFLAYSNEE